ncbi:MAG: hypothetical protein EOM17_11700 [Synergistales bacterium]|nr:hypothetical protein [Synergistales bacterium]
MVNDFSGGLNLADNPSLLKENQLLTADNFQYTPTGGRIETRDGIVAAVRTNGPYPPLASSSYILDVSGGKVLYANSGRLYNDTPNSGVSAGPIDLLSTSSPPVSVRWGDPDVGTLIASGGKLQYFIGGVLSTIEGSPDCSFVSRLSGRVVIAGTTGSRIYLSGLGDHENWDIEGDTWTDLDALWIDIGYKSAGNINAITKVNKDLIIFKEDGVVYRMTGDYPDWKVFEVGHGVRNISSQTATQLANDVVFLDESFGIYLVSSVNEFGDIRVTEFGREINSDLLKHLGSGAAIWNLPGRAELWIKPDTGKKFVYVFNTIHRSWTRFTFPLEPMSAMTGEGNTYAAFRGEAINGNGTVVYKLNRSADKEFSSRIQARMELRPIPSKIGKVLLNRSACDVNGTVLLEGEPPTVTLGANDFTLREKDADGYSRIESYQHLMGDQIYFHVEVEGKCTIDQLSADVVEV